VGIRSELFDFDRIRRRFRFALSSLIIAPVRSELKPLVSLRSVIATKMHRGPRGMQDDLVCVCADMLMPRRTDHNNNNNGERSPAPPQAGQGQLGPHLGPNCGKAASQSGRAGRLLTGVPQLGPDLALGASGRECQRRGRPVAPEEGEGGRQQAVPRPWPGASWLGRAGMDPGFPRQEQAARGQRRVRVPRRLFPRRGREAPCREQDDPAGHHAGHVHGLLRRLLADRHPLRWPRAARGAAPRREAGGSRRRRQATPPRPPSQAPAPQTPRAPGRRCPRAAAPAPARRGKARRMRLAQGPCSRQWWRAPLVRRSKEEPRALRRGQPCRGDVCPTERGQVHCSGAVCRRSRGQSRARGTCWSCRWILCCSWGQAVCGEGQGVGEEDRGRGKDSHCCGSEQRSPRLAGELVRERIGTATTAPQMLSACTLSPAA